MLVMIERMAIDGCISIFDTLHTYVYLKYSWKIYFRIYVITHREDRLESKNVLMEVYIDTLQCGV